jgi:L-ascorbate metabolism protein UlaG (beta-lactamase superfamily)
MKITKFGHCCFLVEENGLRILTDPGSYSTAQNKVESIDIILITHDHQDHLHIDSLKAVLKNSPQARIITNRSVGKLLDKENLPYTVLEDGQKTSEKGVLIEAFGKKHAIMHPTIPQIDNTGYLIGNKLFYPGDALTNPKKPIEILALPVAGPWLKLSEAIDYAKEIKPALCFPVHEGGLKSPGSVYRLPLTVLGPLGISFIVLEIEKETEL